MKEICVLAMFILGFLSSCNREEDVGPKNFTLEYKVVEDLWRTYKDTIPANNQAYVTIDGDALTYYKFSSDSHGNTITKYINLPNNNSGDTQLIKGNEQELFNLELINKYSRYFDNLVIRFGNRGQHGGYPHFSMSIANVGTSLRQLNMEYLFQAYDDQLPLKGEVVKMTEKEFLSDIAWYYEKAVKGQLY